MESKYKCVSPLVRAWLVARLEAMRVGTVLASVALERIVDGFVFVGFTVAAQARRNFRHLSAGGVFFQGGAAAIDTSTIVAGLVHGLTGSTFAAFASRAGPSMRSGTSPSPAKHIQLTANG